MGANPRHVMPTLAVRTRFSGGWQTDYHGPSAQGYRENRLTWSILSVLEVTTLKSRRSKMQIDPNLQMDQQAAQMEDAFAVLLATLGSTFLIIGLVLAVISIIGL